MRFIADGVDIPDELLLAHDEGRVVFFCGAGVSMAYAELPDFNGLTQRVLDQLGAAPDDEARKLHEASIAFGKEYDIQGLATSDQVFQLLKRRFTDREIYEKVAQCLDPLDDVDLSAHKTMLKLGKLQTGETRVITTNFDRLFEKCNRNLASSTRSNLPNLAFNEADWGIVHLHGCVNTDYSGPTGDDFVLSSADFGDAYLAMGWARDFVKEVLNRYVAVFVGYKADDPPIRYLLEGLKQSKGMVNKAYAFQNGQDDKAIASWDEKNVQALVYTTEKGCRHRHLWDTLEECGKRAKNPAKWRKRLLSMSRKGPQKLEPHQRGMIAHIVSSATGAQAFAENKPVIPAEWLCVFDPNIRFGEPGAVSGRFGEGPVVDPHDYYRLDSDPPPRVKNEELGLQGRKPEEVWSALDVSSEDLRDLNMNQVSAIRGYFASQPPFLPRRISHLASWIILVADQPAAAWWAGGQSALHREIMERLRIDYEKESASKKNSTVIDAWRTIVEYHNLRTNDIDRAYELRLQAGRSGWHEALTREYASYFSPSLKLRTLSPIPPSGVRGLKRNDLVIVDVEYSEGIRTVEVPDEYLRPIVSKLCACLKLAEDLDQRYSGYSDICSIEPEAGGADSGSSFTRGYRLSGHVLLFTSLFKRLAVLHPTMAYAELRTWPLDGKVFRRMRIWALGNLNIAPAQEFADELLRLSPENFWPFRGERDLLLGLANRWSELDVGSRKAIEKRIRKGPPKYSNKTDAEHIEHSAHKQLSRLHWLRAQGCDFSFDFDSASKVLEEKASKWKREYAVNAASANDGRVGTVRVETDSSIIEDLPLSDIIPHVQAMETRPIDQLIERAPFLGLSKNQPEKALLALKVSYGEDLYDPSFWQSFLRIENRKDDGSGFTREIADALILLSEDDFKAIALSVSNWFKKNGPSLNADHSLIFKTMWEKFIGMLHADENANKSSLVREDRTPDWVTESINSPAGNLAELAITNLPKEEFKQGEKFSKDWLDKLQDLLDLPGDSRQYALVIISHSLRWFFWVDPMWTKKNIIKVLNDTDSSDSDRDAIWAGFFWNARTPQLGLFEILKPQLIDMVNRESQQISRYLEILAGILLNGWGTLDGKGERLISNPEMRELLLNGNNEFRHHVLWTLNRWSNSEGWSQQIIEFLEDAWPKQKQLRTSKNSAQLCEMALSQKLNFPEIAEIVSRLVTKVGDDQIFIPALRNVEGKVASEHPLATLGLLHALLPENKTRWPYGAERALKTLVNITPNIRRDPRYIELESRQ